MTIWESWREREHESKWELVREHLGMKSFVTKQAAQKSPMGPFWQAYTMTPVKGQSNTLNFRWLPCSLGDPFMVLMKKQNKQKKLATKCNWGHAWHNFFFFLQIIPVEHKIIKWMHSKDVRCHRAGVGTSGPPILAGFRRHSTWQQANVNHVCRTRMHCSGVTTNIWGYRGLYCERWYCTYVSLVSRLAMKNKNKWMNE